MSSDLAATMRATAEGFVMDFDGQWPEDCTQSYRAPECRHKILPSSLETPERNNDDFRAHMKRIGHLIENAKVITNLPNGRSMVHADTDPNR
jgi:hypothetical protein